MQKICGFYVENLKSMTGNQNITGNLITKDELVTLGCNVNSYNCAQSYTCTEGDLLYGYSLIDANNNNQTCTEVGQKIM